MAQFDQRWQQVHGNQQNVGGDQHVGGDLNFGVVRNPVDLASELEKLKNEVARVKQEGILDKKKATDVEYQITKATQEAEETKPNKSTILDHLTVAKSFIEDVAAAGGLVTTLAGAIEAVQKIFF